MPQQQQQQHPSVVRLSPPNDSGVSTSHHRPLTSTSSTTNSLKNFVVTGKGQQSLQSATQTNGGTSGGLDTLSVDSNESGVPSTSNGYQSFVYHQRSRSIGPANRLNTSSSTSQISRFITNTNRGNPAPNHYRASMDRKATKRQAVIGKAQLTVPKVFMSVNQQRNFSAQDFDYLRLYPKVKH